MMFFTHLCYCSHCKSLTENLFSVSFFNDVFNVIESDAVLQTRMNLETYSLDQFLKSVEKRAYRMAYIATKNVDDALDIVQDAMLVLATKYANRKNEEWPPLFFRIVQNKIRDFYRRQKVRNIFQHWFASEDEDNNEDPIQTIADDKIHDPIRKIEGENNISKLEEALKELPARQQQTFLLRAWEGLDVKQTAEAMSITSGSVKTHYSRALKTLREKVGDMTL